MKVFSKLLITSLIFIFSCSSEESEDIECIDETKIDELALCIEIYEPVCGCNGITSKSESDELNALSRKRHGANDHKSNITEW